MDTSITSVVFIYILCSEIVKPEPIQANIVCTCHAVYQHLLIKIKGLIEIVNLQYKSVDI